MPGVTVVATQRLTNVAVVDGDAMTSGRFRFPYLRIGVYDIDGVARGLQGLHARQLTRLGGLGVRSARSCWRSRPSARPVTIVTTKRR